MDATTSPLSLLKDPTLLKTDAMIDGSWIAGASRFDVIDPATGRPASEGAGAARTEASRATGTGPAQAAADAEPSTEAGSARG